MKKKIKDLTEEEALAICNKVPACCVCPLRLCGGDYCVRKGISKYYPKDLVEWYLNKEVVINE